ncbi:tyrosine-protein kinase family protein, partial [Paraburkholderia aspalathi]|nr:tyrosine-protein kinase family protein [Paraburkholderia aspalathi]
ILIDMTGSGVLGHAMLDSDQQAGITDLLVGAKKFTDIIHNDHYSDAHIIPLGQSDPRQAMRSKERLPMILDALGTAYDRVVVECGPSTAPQIEQLASGRTQIILSIVDPEAETVALAAHDLDQRGFDDVIILAAEAGADA